MAKMAKSLNGAIVTNDKLRDIYKNYPEYREIINFSFICLF